MLEKLLGLHRLPSLFAAGGLLFSTPLYANVPCSQVQGAQQVGEYCRHPSGAVYDKGGKEVTADLIRVAEERRCPPQGSLSETIRLSGTGYCVNAAGRVYLEQNGKILDNMLIYQQLIETDDYKFAHLLAQLRAKEKEGKGEGQEPVNVPAAAPAAPATIQQDSIPPYLPPGRMTYSSANPPSEQPAEGSRPLYLPPPGQRYTSSTPASASESETTTGKNKANDVWGYVLTGLGAAGLLYGLFVRQTCNQLTGEEIECSDEIKSKQENARFLLIGGSVAVTGLGVYFLFD